MTPRRTRDGWEIQLRMGAGERKRVRMPLLDETVALEREARLLRMRDRMRDAGVSQEQMLTLLGRAASQQREDLFSEIEAMAEELAATGDASPAVAAEPRTFDDIVTLWTSGALHEQFPDRVRPLVGRRLGQVTQRLGEISWTLGKLPLARITRQDCEAALAALPRGLMVSTRAAYARLIPRVLRLAVLAGALDKSPLSPGWAPSAGARREFQLLYPEEDARLIECHRVPFARRLLWGFLVREGLRISEALALVGDDLDLDRGTITVRDSKTGAMRRWRLGEDVRKALVAYQEREGWGGSQYVFPRVSQPAKTFRQDLRDCELRRRELHVDSPTSRNVTVHDLRGTFVTISLATGKPINWIMRRTGHRKISTIDAYRRAVDFTVEHEMKWFGPLDSGLVVAQNRQSVLILPPETQEVGVSSELRDDDVDAAGSNVGAAPSGRASAKTPLGHPPHQGGTEPGPSGESPTSNAGAGAAGNRAAEANHGQAVRRRTTRAGAVSDDPETAPAADPLVRALTLALELAVAAKDLDRVALIVAELREWRLRSEPGVVSLGARKRRNGDE